MNNQPKTIYEIRYDFDLDGETVEMQEGVHLSLRKKEKGVPNNTPFYKIGAMLSTAP